MFKYPNNLRFLKCFDNFKKFLIKLNYDLLSIQEAMESIPRHLLDYDKFHYYVMALEDRRFCKHCGIDLKSILREIWKCVTGKRYGGASTIDMQMVRTITGFKEKTIKRKLYEANLAFIVNFKYSKNEIIACYVSNAFFGSQMYGINKAVEIVYGVNRDLYDLNLLEKAKLAAMLQKPRPLKPSLEWKDKIARRARYAQKIIKDGKVCN